MSLLKYKRSVRGTIDICGGLPSFGPGQLKFSRAHTSKKQEKNLHQEHGSTGPLLQGPRVSILTREFEPRTYWVGSSYKNVLTLVSSSFFIKLLLTHTHAHMTLLYSVLTTSAMLISSWDISVIRHQGFTNSYVLPTRQTIRNSMSCEKH